MERKLTANRLAAAIGAAALAGAMSLPAGAVVVVGGDNGWEVSFDGNVNGFWVNEDVDNLPTSLARTAGACGAALGTTCFVTDGAGSGRGGTVSTAAGFETSRVMVGLLPTFYSFNVKSPEVNGLRGSARFSFAPSIQNAQIKNQTNVSTFGQNGSNLDMREVLFNVDGSFGTISVGRTLSLHQRQNILRAYTTWGVGPAAAAGNGGTALGSIGYGYVYPNFNARISYKTPDLNGLQVEVGLYDTSTVGGYTQVDTPRFEAEATYAGNFAGGNIDLWVGGLWQEAELPPGAVFGAGVGTPASQDVTVWGVHYGVDITFGGFNAAFMGYNGEGLGPTLQMAGGLGLDANGFVGEEADADGFIAQGSYTFAGRTKVGIQYGENNVDETANDRACRLTGLLANGVAGCGAAAFSTTIEQQSAWTVGVYHDVTSWLKLVAEYTSSTDEFHSGGDVDTDTFALGGFFTW